jgi:hypothetical protein
VSTGFATKAKLDLIMSAVNGARDGDFSLRSIAKAIAVFLQFPGILSEYRRHQAEVPC